MNDSVTGIDSVELEFQYRGFPTDTFSPNLSVAVLYWIPPHTESYGGSAVVEFHSTESSGYSSNFRLHSNFQLQLNRKNSGRTVHSSTVLPV